MTNMSAVTMMRSLALAAVLSLLMATACKSDVDRVIDWYEEASPSIRRSLPNASQCGRWEGDYWWMVGLMDKPQSTERMRVSAY